MCVTSVHVIPSGHASKVIKLDTCQFQRAFSLGVTPTYKIMFKLVLIPKTSQSFAYPLAMFVIE